MELEKNVMLKFIEYLKIHGYPANSLATEYSVGKNHRVDLAVIDPTTNIPIMIFELKSKKNSIFLNKGKEQLKKYLKLLPDNSIPAYLVFPKTDEPYFEVLRIENENNDELITMTSFDYKSQRNARLSEKAEQSKSKKKKIIDTFQILAWILSILVLILLICKKIHSFQLDPVDLTLIGVIIGLVLIPYANKIKLLGIEFEKFTNAKKE